MIRLRSYREHDSIAVAILIADVYRQYVLETLPENEKPAYLGPFYNASSPDPAHQQQIAMLIQDTLVFVAEDEEGKITGVLRGRPGRLHGLYVHDWFFFQDTGRKLVERFEQNCRDLGSKKVKLASPLFAVPFYLRMGYKKSTGLRNGPGFGGRNLLWQPMKKKLG
jgi:GNAT superfamily N-acetyltransferase